MIEEREKTEIKQSSYIEIDIETSGLDSTINEIIRIDAVKKVDDKIVGEFFSYIKPQKPLSEACMFLTGITNEMLVNEKSIDKVLPGFINFIGDLPIVSSNKQFDLSFLNAAFKKAGRPLLDNEIINM